MTATTWDLWRLFLSTPVVISIVVTIVLGLCLYVDHLLDLDTAVPETVGHQKETQSPTAGSVETGTSVKPLGTSSEQNEADNDDDEDYPLIALSPLYSWLMEESALFELCQTEEISTKADPIAPRSGRPSTRDRISANPPKNSVDEKSTSEKARKLKKAVESCGSSGKVRLALGTGTSSTKVPTPSSSRASRKSERRGPSRGAYVASPATERNIQASDDTGKTPTIETERRVVHQRRGRDVRVVPSRIQRAPSERTITGCGQCGVNGCDCCLGLQQQTTSCARDDCAQEHSRLLNELEMERRTVESLTLLLARHTIDLRRVQERNWYLEDNIKRLRGTREDAATLCGKTSLCPRCDGCWNCRQMDPGAGPGGRCSALKRAVEVRTDPRHAALTSGKKETAGEPGCHMEREPRGTKYEWIQVKRESCQMERSKAELKRCQQEGPSLAKTPACHREQCQTERGESCVEQVRCCNEQGLCPTTEQRQCQAEQRKCQMERDTHEVEQKVCKTKEGKCQTERLRCLIEQRKCQAERRRCQAEQRKCQLQRRRCQTEQRKCQMERRQCQAEQKKCQIERGSFRKEKNRCQNEQRHFQAEHELCQVERMWYQADGHCQKERRGSETIERRCQIVAQTGSSLDGTEAGSLMEPLTLTSEQSSPEMEPGGGHQEPQHTKKEPPCGSDSTTPQQNVSSSPARASKHRTSAEAVFNTAMKSEHETSSDDQNNCDTNTLMGANPEGLFLAYCNSVNSNDRTRSFAAASNPRTLRRSNYAYNPDDGAGPRATSNSSDVDGEGTSNRNDQDCAIKVRGSMYSYDPSGQRGTSHTYDPDGGGSGYPYDPDDGVELRGTSYTYDPDDLAVLKGTNNSCDSKGGVERKGTGHVYEPDDITGLKRTINSCDSESGVQQKGTNHVYYPDGGGTNNLCDLDDFAGLKEIKNSCDPEEDRVVQRVTTHTCDPDGGETSKLYDQESRAGVGVSGTSNTNDPEGGVGIRGASYSNDPEGGSGLAGSSYPYDGAGLSGTSHTYKTENAFGLRGTSYPCDPDDGAGLISTTYTNDTEGEVEPRETSNTNDPEDDITLRGTRNRCDPEGEGTSNPYDQDVRGGP